MTTASVRDCPKLVPSTQSLHEMKGMRMIRNVIVVQRALRHDPCS